MLVFSQTSENIMLLSSWSDETIPARKPSARYNEVWGFVQDGREYGVIGSTMGTHIIDVTDPTNIYEVDFVEGAFQRNWVTHRDFKDYNGYLYGVCDQGKTTSTLQVMDLSYLPDSVHVVYDTSEFFFNSHNIFIDTAKAKLYACLGDKIGILSLEDPEKPTLIAEYGPLEAIHDLYVRNDTGYLHMGEAGFKIVNLEDPDNVLLYDEITYPREAAYNHSGWLSEDGSTYVYCEETIGRTVKVCELDNKTNATVVSEFYAGEKEHTLAHNVVLMNGVAYVSYYLEGLQIFDITDRKVPRRVAYYDPDAESEGIGFGGVWGVYPFLPSGNVLISDRGNGLLVLDASPAFVSVDAPILNRDVEIFPNPFMSNINVGFTVGKNQNATISLHDINGRKVVELMNTFLYSGEYEKDFDLSTYSLNAGIYIVHITLEDKVLSKRMVKR
jgi:choice-of-anchor B domain-containing protein